MREWFWSDGRFGWPFVIAFVYIAAFVVVTDYVWRVLTLPVETLVMTSSAAFVGCAIAMLVARRFLIRRRAGS